MTFQIREAHEKDLAALMALDNVCFYTPWSKAAVQEELVHEQAYVCAAFVADKLVAALFMRQMPDAFWMLRVMVHPEYARRGIAQKLLRFFEASIFEKAQNPVLMLEVAARNQVAIAYYSSEGFVEVGRRKGYYHDFDVQGEDDAIVMCRNQADDLDYALLDSGDGYKLERIGNNAVMRPEKSASHSPKNPIATWRYDLCARECKKGAVSFERGPYCLFPWLMRRGNLWMTLHAEASRNVGVFPEQENNWRFMRAHIEKNLPKETNTKLRVLNLFAYTGVASLVCAQAGAEVTHVDAAKSTVRWASENWALSGKPGQIRWIVDDAKTFVQREIKRGKTYDAVILDPPPIGRFEGKAFVFHEEIVSLLKLIKQLLVHQPIFFVLNSYAMGLVPEDVKLLVQSVFTEAQVEALCLSVEEKRDAKALLLSVCARFNS